MAITRGRFSEPREGALGAITRGRFSEPAEMRQWVISQAQRRTTLVGLLGYIP